MGYKTILFTNEIEQRTYVQGEFTGKYHGVLNQENWRSNFENYDIHIYEGEINQLKNEKEHPGIINKTIYNSIISETQLTQRIFKNVLVNVDKTVAGYDSFTLAIKNPKLESVQIFDVEKDGNQTFGTLTCFVSGYLLKTSFETSEIETCDPCDQFSEECTCNDIKPSNGFFVEEPVLNPNAEESFWSRNFGSWINNNKDWGWDIVDNSGFGCLGLFGLLLGILVLFSFGLPGILVGAFIFLIYALSGQLTRSFPNLTRGFRWIFFVLIWFLLLGGLFYTLWGDRSTNTYSIPQQNNESSKTQINEEIKNSPNSIPVNSNSQNVEKSTAVKQNATFGTDAITNGSQESSEAQNTESINLTQFPAEGANSSHEENVKSQTEEINYSPELTPEFPNNEQNNVSQISGETQTQGSGRRQKIGKTVEIMAGIEFHEGEVFICKGKSSKRYHFNPNCAGLSNCSTRIYQINIPSAERQGRTLCKIEE